MMHITTKVLFIMINMNALSKKDDNDETNQSCKWLTTYHEDSSVLWKQLQMKQNILKYILNDTKKFTFKNKNCMKEKGVMESGTV